jgi:hypothetical protein
LSGHWSKNRRYRHPPSGLGWRDRGDDGAASLCQIKVSASATAALSPGRYEGHAAHHWRLSRFRPVDQRVRQDAASAFASCGQAVAYALGSYGPQTRALQKKIRKSNPGVGPQDVSRTTIGLDRPSPKNKAVYLSSAFRRSAVRFSSSVEPALRASVRASVSVTRNTR